MYIAKDIIAVGNRIYDDTNRTDVINLIYAFVLLIHLTVNAINMLYPGGNGVFNAAFIELGADCLFDALEHFLMLTALAFQTVYNFLVANRIQTLQGKILQLPFDLLHAQSVGNRCINLHGFQRFGALLLHSHKLNRPHIVQTIRQLNQDDTDILCHGNQHFAEILHLFLLLGIVQLSQTGDTIHQVSNRFAELFRNLVILEVGILHTVMQQSGTDGIRIQTHFNNNSRYRNRVDDIRVTIFAFLTRMRGIGTLIRHADFIDIRIRCLFLHAFN